MSEQDEELILDYVLGALDEVSCALLEARIAKEPELAAALNRCEETVAMGLLADTPDIAPPSGLRDRLMAFAETESESETVTATDGAVVAASDDRNGNVRRVAFAGWGLAAALAIMASVLMDRVGDRGDEVNQLRTEIAAERESLQRIGDELTAVVGQRELLLARVAQLDARRALDQIRIATLSSQLADTSYGFAVFDTQADEGVIEVVNLPQIQSSQDYQLWVVDPQYPNPVDGGIVRVGVDGRARVRFQANQPVENVAAFAISLERKGGVPVAEGPMVLVGSL
jgi:anti-sigma-K factor RskA